jgi:uncharacterized phage-like protein YoqJ
MQYYVDGYTKFISGGAQGFDQLAFWTVDMLKSKVSFASTISNTLYVPFDGQERIWREDGLFGQQQYRNMKAAADEVVMLQDTMTNKTQVAKALTDRNHKMVDAADLVVALYSADDWETAYGGTTECMRYTKKQHKPIVQIYYAVENNALRIKSTKFINN